MKRLLSGASREYFKQLTVAVVCTLVLQLSVAETVRLPFFGLPFVRFLVNVLLVLAPISLSSWILGRRRTLIAVGFLAPIFAFANYLKIGQLSEPILFTDLEKVQFSSLLLKYVTPTGASFHAWMLLIIPLVLATAFCVRHFALSGKGNDAALIERFSVAVIAWLTVAVFALQTFGVIHVLNPGFRFEPYAPLRMARDNGYPLTELMSLRYILIQEPTGYSSERVLNLLRAGAKLAALDHRELEAQPARHDVVVVLLESFKDFQKTVRFRSDFTPNYHQLKKHSERNDFQSPVYGGGTANAEYEVLTGMSTGYLPVGSIAYAQYVKTKVPSVVHWFRRSGFQTTAIHNNVRTFWSRDKVYPLLGFDQFIDGNDLGAAMGENGEWNDDLVFRRSIELLKKASGKPQFQFLITMGTHGPYSDPLKSDRWHHPEQGNAGVSRELNNYAAKMNELDQDLGAYLAELKKLLNPPTVIFFGDHQPGFAARLEGNTSPETYHRVEAVVWNWTRPDEPWSGGRDLSCLSPVLLRAGGIRLSPYFHFVEKVCRDPDESLAEQHRLLCYDRLFGEQYSVRLAKQIDPELLN